MNAVLREKPQVQIKVSIEHWSCTLVYFLPPKPTFTDLSLPQNFPKANGWETINLVKQHILTPWYRYPIFRDKNEVQDWPVQPGQEGRRTLGVVSAADARVWDLQEDNGYGGCLRAEPDQCLER